MHQRHLIDPESRAPLEEFLREYPGGFAAISDIVKRRETLEAYAAKGRASLPVNERIRKTDSHVDAGSHSIPIRIYRPPVESPLPVIFFIHSGGMVLGSIEREDPIATRLADELNALVISFDYRLAPEHPYPAAVDDCQTVLAWIVDNGSPLNADLTRLVVYGASAGGGLALATALRARDAGHPQLHYVMAIYPMIDDRNVSESSKFITDVGIWDRGANLEGWSWYLGGQVADQYAAPYRATDLTGLPPTFIDVGTVDLFRDEDIEFAQRLMAAGVPVELHVYPGAFHGGENVAPDAELSRRIWGTRLQALRRALL